MIHDLDLVLELAGSSVVHLAAAGGRSSSGPIDYVNATLGFENGVVASLTASKMSHRKIRSLSAHCRSSLVETDFLNHNLHIHRRAHEWYSADHGELLYRNDGFIEEVSTTSIEPLYAELEHFPAVCVVRRPQLWMDSRPPGRCGWLISLSRRWNNLVLAFLSRRRSESALSSLGDSVQSVLFGELTQSLDLPLTAECRR